MKELYYRLIYFIGTAFIILMLMAVNTTNKPPVPVKTVLIRANNDNMPDRVRSYTDKGYIVKSLSFHNDSYNHREVGWAVLELY